MITIFTKKSWSDFTYVVHNKTKIKISKIIIYEGDKEIFATREYVYNDMYKIVSEVKIPRKTLKLRDDVIYDGEVFISKSFVKRSIDDSYYLYIPNKLAKFKLVGCQYKISNSDVNFNNIWKSNKLKVSIITGAPGSMFSNKLRHYDHHFDVTNAMLHIASDKLDERLNYMRELQRLYDEEIQNIKQQTLEYISSKFNIAKNKINLIEDTSQKYTPTITMEVEVE